MYVLPSGCQKGFLWSHILQSIWVFCTMLCGAVGTMPAFVCWKIYAAFLQVLMLSRGGTLIPAVTAASCVSGLTYLIIHGVSQRIACLPQSP